MRDVDVPLLAALVAGGLVLVVGVGSVFVAPAGHETVEPDVDVAIARPVPAPAPRGLGLRGVLADLEAEDTALRDELLRLAAAGDADPSVRHELYLTRWDLASERDSVLQELRFETGEPTFDERSRSLVTAEDDQVAAAFSAFLEDPTDVVAAELFADEVQLGVEWRLLATRQADELTDASAWEVGDAGTVFSGATGPFDLLSRAREVAFGGYAVKIGEHPHCGRGPKPAPVELDRYRRVNLVREDPASGCETWASIELYVDLDDGRIHGVTWDAWQP